MRGADIDDVCVTANPVVQMIETDLSIAFSKPRLQYSHSNCVALRIVKCDVANLKRRVRNVSNRIESVRCIQYTLAVIPARSNRYIIVLPMLLPVCFFFMHLKPIRAHLRSRCPRSPSEEIQCAVSAK